LGNFHHIRQYIGWILLTIYPVLTRAQDSPSVSVWLTNPDRSALFRLQKQHPVFTDSLGPGPIIAINDHQVYQTMDGFGFALTDGSAMLIHRMSSPARNALLNELFGTGENDIGISYLRISIGASDLSDRVFSYDDLPDGETDPYMQKFSLGPDTVDLVPVLKEILRIDPGMKILGSPWSAPLWMKDNHRSVGGSLKRNFYGAYARYFIHYIRSMQQEGIPISAVTIQNEPLNPGNNPSMVMLPGQQDTFIRNDLGPAFQAARIRTKIILYDHNADRVDYPIRILNDPQARKYIDGSAFHLYGGSINALTAVHDAWPDKNLYFTEQWVGYPANFGQELGWHVKNLIIGAPRNWCKNVLEWNLASDSSQEPHTPGGCNRCLGGITIQGDSITRNPGYYIIAHGSKFVRPGSVRIASNMPDSLYNVAFRTPSDQIVLIVENSGVTTQSFNILFHGKTVISSLEQGAVATYIWKNEGMSRPQKRSSILK